MSDSSSDLIPRLLTAGIGIPILLYVILGAPSWAFLILVAAAGGVGTWEYCSITYADEHTSGKVVTTAVGTGLFATYFFAPDYLLESVIAAAIIIASFFLLTFEDKERVSLQVSASMTALLYSNVFLGVLLLIHAVDGGPYWVVLTLVTVWMTDTTAYFAGRAFGKHPLYEKVSPKKTIEGSIGGILGAVGGALAANWIFFQVGTWEQIPVVSILILALPTAILEQIGDLSISLVKRSHEVKDAGAILYGHGGILDRIDGLIFAAPWFYVCVVRLLPHLQG